MEDYARYVLSNDWTQVKRFRTDNDKAFISVGVQNFLQGKGIVHELLTAPHSPKENGQVERGLALVTTIAISITNQAHLEIYPQLTGFSLLHGIRLANLTYHTPGSSADLPTAEIPFIYGSVAFLHVPKVERKKYDRRSVRAVYIGRLFNMAQAADRSTYRLPTK
jgi:hypothetical protein